MKIFNPEKIQYLILFLIIIVSFVLRLYKIDNPIADWHSWRQADTSSVSRNFQKFGFDVLHPRYDDLSSIQSGLENPMGYRMVEFPFYNLIQAEISNIFPQRSLEWWGRMISIIFSMFSLIFVYLLSKKFLGWQIGLLAAFFFGTLPYNIYYSRVILVEPLMVFTALGAIFFFIKWIENEKNNVFYLLISLFFSMITLLLKPFGVFMILPVFFFVWEKWRLSFWKKFPLYLYGLLSILPFIVWRVWINQFPEGIPFFIWLFNSDNIRFKGAFFRWIFAERIGRLILGFWGLPLLVLGLLKKVQEKKENFFYVWLISMVIYLFLVAGGNVRHDYYQIMIIPILCIFLAKGSHDLVTNNFSKKISYPLFAICILFMLAFSWYEVKGYYNINRPEIVIAGKEADKILPKSAKVIAPFEGDTAFLYQINRQGWPYLTNTVEYLISRGATHYVSVNFDAKTNELIDKYQVIEKTDKFVIIDLITPKK